MRDEDGSSLVGFFTVRKVVAKTCEEAEVKALGRLLKEAKIVRLLEIVAEAHSPNAKVPKVELHKMDEISWWDWIRIPTRMGLIFYPESEEPDEPLDRDSS